MARPRMSVLIVLVFMIPILLGSIGGCTAKRPDAGPVAGQQDVIVLNNTVLFENKAGEDLMLQPGRYRVSAHDTESIRLTAENNRAFDVRAATGTHTEMLDRPEAITSEQEGLYRISWLVPGGRRLETVGYIGGVRTRATVQLLIPPTQISQLRLQARIPQFEPACSIANPKRSGTQIAYSKGVFSDNEIYVMNADGTGERRLTSMVERNASGNVIAGPASPSMSPDGTKVAFIRLSTEFNPPILYSQIFVMNMNGTELRSLSSDIRSKDMSPSWSPDGTKIAFRSFRDVNPGGDANLEIYVMKRMAPDRRD